MLREGIQPDTVCYNAMLSALEKGGQVCLVVLVVGGGLGRFILEWRAFFPVCVCVFFSVCVFVMYMQYAKIHQKYTSSPFHPPRTLTLPIPHPHTPYPSLPLTLQVDAALDLFHSMRKAGLQASSTTYATLVEVFTQQDKWDLLQTALQVKEWLEAQGVDPEVCVCVGGG